MRSLVLPLLLASLALPAAADPTPPNIIYILLDDIGINDLRVYSDLPEEIQIETPQIDKLAADGVLFSNYYTSPVCSPTRFSLLTGDYPQAVNVRKQINPGKSLRGIPGDPAGQIVTLAEMLQNAGYHTAHFGKWHVGKNDVRQLPRNQGFDYSALLEPFEYCTPSFIVDTGAGAIPTTANFVNLADTHSTDLILLGNAGHNFPGALGYIEDLDTNHPGEPFFVSISLWAPHANGVAGDNDNPTCALNLQHAFSEGTNCCPAFDSEILDKYLEKFTVCLQEDPDCEEEEEISHTQAAAYAALIDHADKRIGTLLKKLDELELADNTIVIVAGDNGGIQQQHPVVTNGSFRNFKGEVYDGGIRSPMIVRWPDGAAAAITNPSVLMVFDVLPTLADAAGITPPAGLPGVSFLPALADDDPVLRGEPIFFESRKCNFRTYGANYMTNDFAVRSEDDWKMVFRGQPSCPNHCSPTTAATQSWELFNLGSDPYEITNLFGPTYADKIDAMFKEYLDWRAERTLLPFAPDQLVGEVEVLGRDLVAATDATDSLIRLPANQLYSSHDGEISFSTWIQPLSIPNAMILATKDGSWRLRVGSDGRLRLRVWQDATNSAEVVGTTVLSAGAWRHVAFSIEGWDNCRAYARIFLDGVLEAEGEVGHLTASLGGVPVNDNRTFLAGDYNGNQDFHGVMIDNEISVRAFIQPELDRMVDSRVRFDSFETNSLTGWTLGGSGSKTITTAAGLVGYYGVTLAANNSTETATLVDETPNSLRSLRTQLTVDLSGVTVPSGQVMNLVAFRDDSPATNLVIVRLRTNGGNLEAQLLSIDHQSSVVYDQSTFAALGAGVKTLEIDWQGDPDNDGTPEGKATLKVNGSAFASLTGLDDWGWGADRAVMGFLHTITGGSSQTILLDHYKAYTTPAVAAP